MSHFLHHLCVFFLATAALVFAAISVEGIYVFPQLRENSGGFSKCDPDVPQWSGYFVIPGTHGEKHYFYWAFGPRNKNPKAPVILWMTGGPGCSSMLALLAENGPCLVNETTGNIYKNKYSWNNEAYVIYIDQPAGVGFSTADMEDYDTNEKSVSDDMYNFLQAFFAAHTDLQKNEFFIIAESYGGHFAPATAYRILQGNENNEGLPIRLTGLSVGNGYTNPYVQEASYPELAWDWCIEKLGRPCVTRVSYIAMKALVPPCQRMIAACDSASGNVAAAACLLARLTCTPILGLYSTTGLNVYDIRKKCKGEMCYNFDAVTAFMNREDVQKELGVKPQRWNSCNMGVNLLFAIDWFKNFNYTLPVLLKRGVRVMMYSGEMDFICNWIGNKEWIMDLEWTGKKDFNSADDISFVLSDGTKGGIFRTAADAASKANLTFVQVFKAGHMVPMDQPATAMFIINKFLQNESLG